MTVSAKTCTVAPKLNSILLSQFTDTLIIYPSPVYQVLNVNKSAFLKIILPTLQSHGWNTGTNVGCQLGSGDLDLCPLTLWPTDVSLATMWASWLLMGCPKQGFLPPPTPPPIPSTPSIINTDGREGQQKYHEIHPSEIEKLSFNKNQ